MNMKSLALVAATFASAAAIGTSATAGSTLKISYFDVPDTAGGPDFGTCCSSPPATLPVIALGSALSGGLPVTTLPYTSGGVFDQSLTGQIQWWTPSLVTGITYTGGSISSLPYSSNMFAPNSKGTNDGTFFETAVLSGTFTSSGGPQSISISSDDDSFVYIDGQYVGGISGVHPVESTTIPISALSGVNTIDIFYADRAQVAAFLSVGVTGITTSGVPEPATWAMMMVGFGAMGVAMRSRRKQGVAAA